MLRTINDDDSGLTYMISYTNTMPEGTNGFGDIGALLIAGGRVLFAGDDYPRTPAGGFFSMPFTGSVPTVLVNGNTTIPDSTAGFMLNVLNKFTADTANLAFGVPQGCFSVPITGGTVSRIDVLGASVYETNYGFNSMGGFALPAVSGTEVVLNPFNAWPGSGVPGPVDRLYRHQRHPCCQP